MAAYQYRSEKRKGLIAISCIASVAILAALVALAFYRNPAGEATPAGAEDLAIAVSSNRLDFGNIPLKGSAVRQLVVRNDGDEPIRAEIAVDSSRFTVSPGELILHPGISSRISVAAMAELPGTFDGELHIRFGGDDLVVGLAGSAGVVEEQTRPSVLPGDSNHLRASKDGAGNPGGDIVDSRYRRDALLRDLPMGVHSATSGVASEGTQETTGAAQKRRTGTAEQKRRTATRDDAQRPQTMARIPEGASATILPYDPATAVPFRSLAEKPAAERTAITAEDAKNAARVPSTTGGDAPLPDSLEKEEADPWERDIFEDDDDDASDDDPFHPPTLTISAQSTVRLMGSMATFYPQQIGVSGATNGGPLSLMGEMQVPQVALAFGESMVFAQAAPISGGFDSSTGTVSLQFPVRAVDSDGDAAPMVLNLTTGTVLGRNSAGMVVSLSGTPRAGDTGVMRLVAIEKIPAGFRNGGEEHLALFEILAQLKFGNTSISSSHSSLQSGRIGG